MAGSDADTEHDPAAEMPREDAGSVPSETLAKFLTPVPPAPARVGRPPAPLAGLFSDPPIPRKGTSSIPPTTSPSDPAPHPLPSRPPIDLDPLKLIDESRLARGTGENERAHLDTFDDESLERSSLPPPLFKSWPSRLTALAAGICLGLLGVQMFAIRSTKRPDRPPVAAVVGAVETPPAPAPADPAEDENGAVPSETDQPIDEATARELRLQARRLLESGLADQGVALARRAIAANPNDPESYVLLAAGLQDLGRWQESREVFSKCVRASDRKANAECIYFATRSE
jgi:hypothetical protein